jgi:hypothetical protein
MTDIVALILADQARIRCLFEELESSGDDESRLRAVWAELAGCLRVHLDAAAEVVYLPLLDGVSDRAEGRRDLAAEDFEIKEAMAEACLQRPGSRLWWLAVRAAQTAAGRRMSTLESRLLPRFCRQAPGRGRQAPGRDRQELGRQWTQCTTALARDQQTPPSGEPGG